MTLRIAIALAVTFLPACGVAARPTSVPPTTAVFPAATAELAADSTVSTHPAASGYVVGPIEQAGTGVRTYYIVRN